MTPPPATSSLSGLRILHVVPCLAVGGLELALVRLSATLQAAGAVQCVVGLTGEPIIAERFAPGIAVHALRGLPREAALRTRLRAVLREFRPDVIHCRNWSSWPDTVRARGLLFPRTPLVFSFHGTSEPAPMPFARRLAMRTLARWTTEIFTVSEAARSRLVEEVGLAQKRVGLIPNGIVLPAEVECAAPRGGERFVIGAVGNLHPIKNHALLLRAFAELRAAGIDAELRIAGEGPMRAPLEALARELNIQDRVAFPGHVEAVRGFLQQLDAFVLCSHLEAHPNSLIEAMALKLPCVGTRVGGIPEVLAQGDAGLLVPNDDATALSAALQHIHADASLAARLGERARARCATAYSLDAMVGAYMRLYARLAPR